MPHSPKRRPRLKKKRRQARDTSQYQRAQESLGGSEESFLQLFANNPHSMCIYDRESLRFLEVNDAAIASYGYSREEFLAMRITDVYHPEDLPRLRSRLAEPRAELRASGGWRHRLKDGRIIEVEVASHTLDFAGRTAVLATVQDVTERKRAQEALRESHAMLSAFIEGTPDAVFMKDLQGRYLTFNSTAARIWGRTAADTFGKTDFEIFPHEIARKFHARDQHVISSGETITYEDSAIREGAARTFLVNKGPIRDDQGKIVGVFGVARDITERKRAEQLQAVVYRLAEAADRSPTLDDLYRAVHQNIQTVMLAKNFYIALYDEKEDLLSFPYWVDEIDVPLPPDKPGKGVTAYVLRTGKSLLCTLAKHEELERRGEIELVGVQSPIWLGVPLRIGEKTIGVMAVQHYSDASAYTAREQQMLEYVSSQVAKAIERKRAEEALRKSESHLRAILDTEPECVKCVAADGTLLEMNPAGLAMIEADSAEQVFGRKIYPLVVPEHREAFRALTERVCRGERGTLDFEIVGLKGTRRCLETHAVPLRRESSGAIEMLGVTRDITERRRAEEALRKSQKQYQELVDDVDAIVWEADANTLQFSFVSRRAELVLGYPIEQWLTEPDFRVNHISPEDRDFAVALCSKAVASGKDHELQYRMLTRDGRPVFLHDRVRVIRDAEGRPAVLRGVMMDITERKLREEFERKLFHAVEHSGEIIFMTEPDSTITYVNPAFQKIYGFTKEEALGKTPQILKGETWPREHYEQFWKTLLAGKSVRGEFENRTKDGRLITVQGTVSPVFDAQGKMMGVIAVQEDITAYKFAEEALRQSEARFRGLFESATLGIYRSTQDGRFLEVNPALVAMLGYNSREELLAVSMAEDIYANPADRERLVKEYADRETVEIVPVQWKHKNGTPISVRLSGRAVHDEQGAFAYFEIFVEDVTGRQALEKQFYAAQKFEAIGHLASGVAHDFNNVLGAIMGWAELCRDSASGNPKLQKGLGVIIEQANHAVGLTRQLLAFARRQHMEPRVINLNNSVRDVSTLLGSVIGQDIELKTSLAPNLSSVLADPAHLEQVLMNLCVNARDAMPHGGKLIIETKNATVDEDYCRLHPYAQPGQYVQLSVSDSGVGMDAGTLDHIFEPFFTTKELGKGTGLGLATVYGIAKQHGGFIHAYSELGQGSTFHVYFPTCPEAPLNANKAEAPALRGGTETILLAEDNEDLAASAREALESRGYSVLWARDGEEAVRLFELHRDRVALLVFDVIMPKLNGPDAYLKIRALRDPIPALFTSGHSFESLALGSLVERGAELLQKPYSTEALLLKIRERLDCK